jgi:hypothetical protein
MAGASYTLEQTTICSRPSSTQRPSDDEPEDDEPEDGSRFVMFVVLLVRAVKGGTTEYHFGVRRRYQRS